ncbi:hypothetical protein DFH07DRAFT_770050 [Mycena maculata]|uniref:Uncharacterized protein n=1 Tax=Mycena maculata TaxID=230809 RepID=A0AAD7NM36_9AGAR|nr:hypothetical protein DFH07DRAFT_770050 [Mycena maculata]
MRHPSSATLYLAWDVRILIVGGGLEGFPTTLTLTLWQFNTVNTPVQEQFEGFLRKRGMDEGTALFLPKYAEKKELEGIEVCLLVKGPKVDTRLTVKREWEGFVHSLSVHALVSAAAVKQ